jgi:MFS family permease
LSPIFWTLSDNILYIFILQIFSGIGWGLQDLSMAMLIVNRIQGPRRLLSMAFLNTVGGLGLVAGVVVGSQIFSAMTGSRDAYHFLFAATTGLRLLSCLLIFRIDTSKINLKTPIIERVLGVRPNFGFLARPILGFTNSKSKEYSATKKKNEET